MTLFQRLCLCSVAIFTASCFEPASQRCTSGVVCPAGFECTADGRQCVRTGDSCGNGIKEAGEACDDGNRNNYDGCRSDCRGAGVCGDALVDSDLNDENGQPLETCDDGNTVGGDGCSADCKSREGCGNGITDEGEDCDDFKDGGHDCNVECQFKRCGDRRLDARFDGGNEVCDVGDTVDGDGCSADCKSNETCGNNITDTAVGEQCDGEEDCASSCRWKRCGDRVRDTFTDGGAEACDDGDADGGLLANGGQWCSETCVLKLCGNGITDMRAAWDGGVRNEECDDGNQIEGDDCGNTCLIPRCGNGHRDPGELCDDGNNVSGDGCASDCRGLEVCGDNRRDIALRDGGSEQCDDGNRDGGDGCRADCQGIEVCGDTHLDPLLLDGGSEACDDGNRVGGDGCRADCVGFEVCGDNLVDPVLLDGGFEQCDDGNRDGGDGCRADCRGSEVCGDFQLDPVLVDGGFELCDDGNTVGGDTCAEDCRSTGQCGNGFVEAPLGEECDDGNGLDNDGCTSLCKLTFCGDTLVRTVGPPTEQCDTGGESLTCNINCTTRICGDGVVNASAGEQCDVPGGLTADAGAETATCDTDCTAAFCGDSKRNATRGEACDTGGNSATCNADCTVAACGDSKLNPNTVPPEQCDTGGETVSCNANCSFSRCGDAIRNATAGEQCDDGNSANDDPCVAGCKNNVCGDGFRNIRDAGFEACDDGNVITEMRCDYGTPVCTGCAADCGAVLNLVGSRCGDNVRDLYMPDGGGEACDDGNIITETSCAYGTATCVACTANCMAQFSLTGGVCGDNVRNTQGDGGLEPCDDGNVTTEPNCPYGQGTCNVCSANCQNVIARTGVFCGDNVINGPTLDGGTEVCDDGNAITETSCAYGTASCTGCAGNCQAQYSLIGPRCGDGITNGPTADGGVEACDDGNTTTETTCNYGTTTCSACNDTCTASLSLTGNVCGDGVVAVGNEQCDDRNISACGTCNSSCSVAQPPVEATGLITTTASLFDGETFTLNDGTNSATVFCFSKPAPAADGGVGTSVCTPSSVAVDVSAAATAETVADAIVAAVNGAPTLGITASKRIGNPWVRLVNDVIGGGRNNAITETVAATGFIVNGMSGGGGRDCAIGVGCSSGNDCASGNCVSNACAP